MPWYRLPGGTPFHIHGTFIPARSVLIGDELDAGGSLAPVPGVSDQPVDVFDGRPQVDAAALVDEQPADDVQVTDGEDGQQGPEG